MCLLSVPFFSLPSSSVSLSISVPVVTQTDTVSVPTPSQIYTPRCSALPDTRIMARLSTAYCILTLYMLSVSYVGAPTHTPDLNHVQAYVANWPLCLCFIYNLYYQLKFHLLIHSKVVSWQVTVTCGVGGDRPSIPPLPLCPWTGSLGTGTHPRRQWAKAGVHPGQVQAWSSLEARTTRFKIITRYPTLAHEQALGDSGKEHLPLPGRNLGQIQGLCGQPSASTGWVERERETEGGFGIGQAQVSACICY